ncbi:MAG TPA: OmpA family protein [Terriglobales bacterium]|nr:OmpA family protein [Terriglobales bacterium]
MAHRVFVVLVSPTLFVSLAFAQQTGSNANPQPPLQNVGTTCTEPLTPAPSSDFWDGEQPNLANLVGHAFNTKKDVQKQTKPIQNCLDELDQAASSHATMIKDLDARTQQGLQLASSKTVEADTHAADATSRANAALQTANQATTRISSVDHVVGDVSKYQGGTQAEIHFRPGQTVLSKTAKEALDQLASTVKDRHNYVIEVRGFAPGHGQAAIADSRRMADSVARYLVLNYQIPMHRIFVLGMGNSDAAMKEKSGTTHPSSAARVEVSLLSNDTLASAQQ